MNLFGYDLFYDMKIFGLGFNIQKLSVFLVSSLINFGVKNQVPQASFKIVVGDLISFHNFGYDIELFGYDMILLVSIF